MHVQTGPGHRLSPSFQQIGGSSHDINLPLHLPRRMIGSLIYLLPELGQDEISPLLLGLRMGNELCAKKV